MVCDIVTDVPEAESCEGRQEHEPTDEGIHLVAFEEAAVAGVVAEHEEAREDHGKRECARNLAPQRREDDAHNARCEQDEIDRDLDRGSHGARCALGDGDASHVSVTPREGRKGGRS